MRHAPHPNHHPGNREPSAAPGDRSASAAGLLTAARHRQGDRRPEEHAVNELRQILDEMSDIDVRLSTPGVLVSGQRDELLSRRRALQSRFDGLQERPDYLAQVSAYTAGFGASDLPLPA